MIRSVVRNLTIPLVYLLMPIKMFAWRLRPGLVRRIVLELTSSVDAILIVVHTQNGAMILHERIYGGDFLFGKSVMVTGYARAAEELPQPASHASRFMGIHSVVADAGLFASNAAPITTSQPARGILRRHLNQTFFTAELDSSNLGKVTQDCSAILREWSERPDMARSFMTIRSATTRIVVKVLGKGDITYSEAEVITQAYMRRLTEFSLFGYYLPGMLAVLGTREGIQSQVFRPLRAAGLDNLVIDMTLFAAMLSIGTIVIKCVEFTAAHGIDYRGLSERERHQFVIESERIYPTVTTVHRILEQEGSALVRGKTIKLRVGDEVDYALACINRDPTMFHRPNEFVLDRSSEEFGRVLSWSKGPHSCPVRNLSVVITVAMLDCLAERFDLRKLRIFNIEV